MKPHRSEEFPFYKTYIDQVPLHFDTVMPQRHLGLKRAREQESQGQNDPSDPKDPSEDQRKQDAFGIFLWLYFDLQNVTCLRLYLYFNQQEIFCNNKTVNWIYNNILNYYTDYTNPIPQSALETSK